MWLAALARWCRSAPLGWLKALPLVVFGALALAGAGSPALLVFDEVHYVPAAEQLVTFERVLNREHPPLAKLIIGLGWLLFHRLVPLVAEPAVYRAVALAFGLWALWSVRAWMLALGFGERAAQASLWLTGFNILWFVQSRTAMLEVFFLGFALWGAFFAYRGKMGGWVLLGLAMACKWAAAPFLLIALLSARMSLSKRIVGLGLAGVCYAAAFLPLGFVRQNPVAITGLAGLHLEMVRSFRQVTAAPHPYASSWWQWPTLLRPMWYTFEREVGAIERGVWAGGNPALYWVALPLLPLAAWLAIRRRDPAAWMLALLYWVPLLFWAVSPRKLQLYYYYLPSSMWVGPIVAWAHERAQDTWPLRRAHGWLLAGFVVLCGLTFLYFLPIMDGRALPAGSFQRYMWLFSWI
jgi:dolichyl-phosphate-mannose--protein O-mannosyl transferase